MCYYNIYRWKCSRPIAFLTLIWEFENALSLDEDPFWSWISRDKYLSQIFKGVLFHKSLNDNEKHSEVYKSILDSKNITFNSDDYLLGIKVFETMLHLKN